MTWNSWLGLKMILEGISYRINWRAFVRGTSIFLPCLHPAPAKQLVRAEARRLKLKILVKTSIEDGIQGLRIWRL